MKCQLPTACLLLAAIFLLVAAPARACPIPVFQYALEWWESDPYEVFVFHDEDLSEAEHTAIKLLHDASSEDGSVKANLLFEGPIRAPEDGLLEHPALAGRPESLPWMVVNYPATGPGAARRLWSGSFTKDNVCALLDSPLRRDMALMLSGGVSTVWVLLESGIARKDDAAAALLREELAGLQETLTLPDPASWGWDDIVIAPIEFDMLRVSRSDEDERIFINMLLNSEIDLVDYNDEPIVFPVYGRGLILYALVGRGINDWTIRDAADFLVGPCSCTVKRLNPGTDLLISFDWAKQVTPLSREFVTEPAGVGGFLHRMDEADERLSREP